MDTAKTIDTPYTNAVALINEANSIFTDYQIKDSTGTEIAQLDQNPSNPAWLFALACGSLHTAWQEQLAKAYACLDPQSCEEDQVLVLAALAGIERGNGTPAHITVQLANNDLVNTVTIPAGTLFSETYSNNSWGLNRNVTLQKKGDAGDKALVTLYNSVDGNYAVAEGVSFKSEDYADVSGESVSESSGGTDIESIASLRNKISQGKETKDPVLKAETAISQLSGIEACSIWFNPSVVDNLNIGTNDNPIIVTPRCAYISVKGVDLSGKLAETYFSYLNVPTTALTPGDTVVEEFYQRGQNRLSIQFQMAEEVVVPVTVIINKADMAVGAEAALASEVMKHSGTLGAGENLTSQRVSEWLQNLGYGTIQGIYISDGGQQYVSSNILPNQYVVFDSEHITISAV